MVMKLQLLMSTGWIVFSAGREPRLLCGASLLKGFILLHHPSSAFPPSVFILLSHLLVKFLRPEDNDVVLFLPPFAVQLLETAKSGSSYIPCFIISNK